ncbi:MAG: hypothetical protein LBU16_04700 [Treponema sp.]|nr:hypothetical protein [Treponema sp.]
MIALILRLMRGAWTLLTALPSPRLGQQRRDRSGGNHAAPDLETPPLAVPTRCFLCGAL